MIVILHICFSIDYNDTLFRALETNTKEKFTINACIADVIDNQYSLFATVVENYFQIDYSERKSGLFQFCPINSELISRVKTNEEFDEFDKNSYMNIIIKFMNKSKIDSNIIPLLESIEFEPSVDLFYCIPMIIYALEVSVEKLMS